MLTITELHANIKTFISLTDIGPLHWFEGKNGSGKSAALQAISLLVSLRADDIRGKEVAQSSSLASLRARYSQSDTAGISIDAVLSDGSAVSAAIGAGRPVKSWPVGLIDESTSHGDKTVGMSNLSRLTYLGFIDASIDASAALLARLIGDPALAIAYEAASEAAKKAQGLVKQLNLDREVFRKYRETARVMAIDVQIDAAMDAAREAKEAKETACAALQADAKERSAAFDLISLNSHAFPSLREKFGLPVLGAHAGPGFPLLGLYKSDGGLDFALSGAEEAFCCMWVAQHIAAIKRISIDSSEEAANIYRVFILPDRDYDSEFFEYLASDVDEMMDAGILNMQIFGARSI